MKRKALFFDIDGTLLSDHKKELPESAARVIAQARRAGHLVFINSGRARCLMQEVEAALPVDGYLCGCGTYLEIQGKKWTATSAAAVHTWRSRGKRSSTM